jgi:hypothetical protein
MTLDLNAITFLFGAGLLAVAILGGGFEVKELKVPKVGGLARFLSGVVGAVFVLIALGTFQNLWHERQSSPSSPPAVAHPASTPQAGWDCMAYADFAIRDVNKAKAANCGFTGRRWSSDSGGHFGWCTERRNAGDDKAMSTETDIRMAAVAECEKAYAANTICPNYAKEASAAAREASQLGCGFQSPRWNGDEGLHYGYCIDRTNAGDRASLENETNARKAELSDCKAAKTPRS